jgi:hypothetical protein
MECEPTKNSRISPIPRSTQIRDVRTYVEERRQIGPSRAALQLLMDDRDGVGLAPASSTPVRRIGLLRLSVTEHDIVIFEVRHVVKVTT